MTMAITVFAEPTNPTEVEKSREFIKKANELAKEFFAPNFVNDQGIIERTDVQCVQFVPFTRHDTPIVHKISAPQQIQERAFPLIKTHLYTHVDHKE
ncbi:MAG: hypothetical protein ACYCX4_06935 [Bacillota bacterium]